MWGKVDGRVREKTWSVRDGDVEVAEIRVAAWGAGLIENIEIF